MYAKFACWFLEIAAVDWRLQYLLAKAYIIIPCILTGWFHMLTVLHRLRRQTVSHGNLFGPSCIAFLHLFLHQCLHADQCKNIRGISILLSSLIIFYGRHHLQHLHEILDNYLHYRFHFHLHLRLALVTLLWIVHCHHSFCRVPATVPLCTRESLPVKKTPSNSHY